MSETFRHRLQPRRARFRDKVCVLLPDPWFRPNSMLSSCRNFDFASVHVAGAERIATIAAQSGVPRLVHVSHLNASPTSKSKFYRTKAEGEDRVKAVFPKATIIRPGSLFGYEDKLLNNMAGALPQLNAERTSSLLINVLVWPIWWKLNHGETKIRPAHVISFLPRIFLIHH
jgi:NADH dehydrogenase (ubiquinone) 1 alpha subcomplex subunit 9